MKIKLLAAVAVTALASGWTVQASAADLAPFAPAPAPPAFSWTGLFVGGHIGYGEADFGGRFHPGPTNDPLKENLFFSGVEPSGILGGVQGGYNWQMGAMVLGIEGDVSFVDWDDTLTNERGDWIGAEVGMLASVRGRLGMAVNRLHVYGTGGIAFNDAEVSAYDWDTDTRGKVDVDNVGWVVGGGAEFMVTDRFSLRAESLYYFFEDSSRLQGIGDHFHQTADGKDYGEFTDAWVIRGGANFHF